MRRALIAFALTLPAAPALAHPGDHAHLTLAQAWDHLLAQPDHQLALAGLVVAIVAGGWGMVRLQATRK